MITQTTDIDYRPTIEELIKVEKELGQENEYNPKEDMSSRSNDPMYHYVKIAREHQKLDSKIFAEYFKRFKEGDNKYGHLIFVHNEALVISIAKKYNRQNIASTYDFEDLISEGNFGLMKAMEKYDPSLKFEFSTYATWWIKNSILRFIAGNKHAIRKPVHHIDFYNNMSKTEKQLYDSLGRKPTEEEIAKEMGASIKYIRQIKFEFEIPLSIDCNYGDDMSLKDIISDNSDKNPEIRSIINQERKYLVSIIDGLKPRQKKVMYLRYGLDDGHYRTLEEVGDIMKVSRERIRQIEEDAINRIKSKLTLDNKVELEYN